MPISFNKQETIEKLAEKDSLFPLEDAIFKEYLSPPGRILDLGCGPDRASRPLKDMGHDVVGVDPDLVEQARKLHPDIEFSVGNATELEFEDVVFDSVHSVSTGWTDCTRCRTVWMSYLRYTVSRWYLHLHQP